MKLPHHVLILPGLPDVLHQPRVVEVGAVEPDAERLFGGDRAGAERLHHFARALAPVAGGESRHGQEQSEEVQGESQRCSPPPVYPHNGDRRSEEAKLNPSPCMTPDSGDFSPSNPHNPVIPVNISAANYRGASGPSVCRSHLLLQRSSRSQFVGCPPQPIPDANTPHTHPHTHTHTHTHASSQPHETEEISNGTRGVEKVVFLKIEFRVEKYFTV